MRYSHGIDHVYVGVKNGLSLSCSMQRSLYASSISKLNFLELIRVAVCLYKCGHVPGKVVSFCGGTCQKERECAILGGHVPRALLNFYQLLKISEVTQN